MVSNDDAMSTMIGIFSFTLTHLFILSSLHDLLNYSCSDYTLDDTLALGAVADLDKRRGEPPQAPLMAVCLRPSSTSPDPTVRKDCQNEFQCFS